MADKHRTSPILIRTSLGPSEFQVA